MRSNLYYTILLLLINIIIFNSCASHEILNIKIKNKKDKNTAHFKLFLHGKVYDTIKMNSNLLFDFSCFSKRQKFLNEVTFKEFKNLNTPYFFVENNLGKFKKIDSGAIKESFVFPVSMHCLDDEIEYILSPKYKLKIMDMNIDIRILKVSENDKKIRIYYVNENTVLKSNWMIL